MAAPSWLTLSTNHVLAFAAIAAVIVALVAIVASSGSVKRQLRQGQAAISTSIRPIIADVPKLPEYDRAGEVTFEVSDAMVRIIVPVRNIGLGPAFIHDAFLERWQQSKQAGTTLHKVLPRDESTPFVTTIAAGDSLFDWIRSRPKVVAIGITYSDIAGNEKTQSVLHLGGPDYTTSYSVQMVQLFECDNDWKRKDQPFAYTGLL